MAVSNGKHCTGHAYVNQHDYSSVRIHGNERYGTMDRVVQKLHHAEEGRDGYKQICRITVIQHIILV
jgi:hypothetical protein